ncbi:LysR family transcriptional regulator [Pseudomonas sp. S2_H01]
MLLEDLRAFAAVVECASLTKAAERLRLTQSAVSRRIQNLEESLGTLLFDRTSRPPVPNLMGFRIYEGALDLLHDAEQLRRIPRETASPSGKFRVGFIQMVADVVVLDAVTSIRKAFPGLEMQVATHWSSELQHLLVEGELDVATLLLSAPSSPPPGLDGTHVATLDILVVQSKRHPVVEQLTTIRSLSDCGWVLNPKGCGYRAALESAMGGHGQVLKLAVDTHGAAIQMRMIAAGLGLGLLPKKVLEESSLSDELSIVEVSDFSLQMNIWVVYPLQQGNLKQANDLLKRHVIDAFRVSVQ